MSLSKTNKLTRGAYKQSRIYANGRRTSLAVYRTEKKNCRTGSDKSNNLCCQIIL